MADVALILMALEPLPRGDWLLHAHEALSATGMCMERRRAELLVWREKRRFGSISYTDAWVVGRIWLAPRRGALGVTSRRLYFLDNVDDIDRRPEQIIVSGVRPQSPPASEQLESQRALIQTLKEGLRIPTMPVTLQQVDGDLGMAREVRIGAKTSISPPSKLNTLYREHGFDWSPSDFTVSICSLESVPEEMAGEFARRLEQAGKQRNLALKGRTESISVITNRLRDLTKADKEAAGGHCLLFVLPSKNQLPQVETMSLFDSLRENRIPFRRAYADDPLEYSIPDQLPSILIAAGGRPHRSPTSASGRPIWTVGVDLSHQTESPVSILALTLVDPDGGLVDAWTIKQQRDETVRIESITVLLANCRKRLASCDGAPNVMVLRDGRMFENEDGNLYSEVLKTHVSLFEYRKRGNPQIAWNGVGHSLIRKPLAALVPGASTMFLVTAPSRDERTLPAVDKVTWRPEWNGLKLKPSEIANILATSAAAPGLGLHPRHLPAAIYWADGIAGANEEDLRFVGVPVNRTG